MIRVELSQQATNYNEVKRESFFFRSQTYSNQSDEFDAWPIDPKRAKKRKTRVIGTNCRYRRITAPWSRQVHLGNSMPSKRAPKNV